ncbi:MAG TPA: hypothetical protein VFJ14_04495 [Nocardioidaceae bacterium]|jgi:hypothetical protein|nr:hypothetical protein [Nocardioidaceae bacterium]
MRQQADTVNDPADTYPQVRARISRARRRRRVAGSAASCLLIAAATLGVVELWHGDHTATVVVPAGSTSPGPNSAPAPPGSYRQAVEQFLRVAPGAVIVAPTRLPAGYKPMDGGLNDYYPTRQGLPGIHVCVVPHGQPAIGTCLPVKGTYASFTREVDGYQVIVATASPPHTQAALRAWQDLTFTTHWRNLAWLDGPNAPTVAPAPTTGQLPALVMTGECAGLTVTASLPPSPVQWRISPGAHHNLLAMPGDALMYLHAEGPCVDRLRIQIDSPLLQTASDAPETPFNADGIGVVVSNGDGPGTGTIDLALGCPASQDCLTAHQLASITVAVGSGPAAALTKDPLPSPTRG